jgi:hypothetical protein
VTAVNVDHLADLAAEQAIIGACLLDTAGATRAQILAAVQPADFYRGAHRTIVETIAGLHRDGTPVDAVTVADRLAGRLTDVGGPATLTDAISTVPSAASGLHYARIVAGLAHRRRVAEAGRRLAVAACDLDVDPDDAAADCSSALAAARRGDTGLVDPTTLVEAALASLDDTGPLGWGWQPCRHAWRIVPGWVHGITGWRSSGKSALLDAMLVDLATDDDVRSLIWSPEGAPSAAHLARLGRIRAGADHTTWNSAQAVEHVAWVADRVRWLDHTRHRTLEQVLAAADAYRTRHRLDILAIDPYTSLDKFGRSDEPWDRMLNRHLTHMQLWARERDIALIVVVHPKQRDRLANNARPVATDADLHGGIMWANQLDSLVSVWRDEGGYTGRRPEHVDVHVQKIKVNDAGGRMGAKIELVRRPSGRYAALTRRHMEAV